MTDDDGNPKFDSSGEEILFPGKNPEELRGVTFKRRFEDGTVRRATVLEPIETNLENEKGR